MDNSFQKIVEAHQQKVFNICFRFTQNMQDTEDLAQEVFIEVYNSFQKFRNEANISTWIYRIAVNKSIDFLRGKKSSKRSVLFSADENEAEKLTDHNTPQTEIENDERRKILFRAVNELPRKQKIVMLLSRFEGMTNQEIAAIMKASVNSIEALIYRANKNLKKTLEKYYSKIFE